MWSEEGDRSVVSPSRSLSVDRHAQVQWQQVIRVGFDAQILIALWHHSFAIRGGLRPINLSMGARKHLRLQ